MIYLYLAAGVRSLGHRSHVVFMVCYALATVRADLHLLVVLVNRRRDGWQCVRVVTTTMTTLIGRDPVANFDPTRIIARG